MSQVPEILAAYIDERWVLVESEKPVRHRSMVARVILEPMLKESLDYLVRLVSSLELLLERSPKSLSMRKQRIAAELTSRNPRNVMGILAELDELDYLLPRVDGLDYFPVDHHPDFMMNLGGRAIFEEVTTLRGTAKSIEEEVLRDDLDWDLARHPSGYILNINYGREPLDAPIRDALKAEIIRSLQESPGEGESYTLNVRDATHRAHKVEMRVISTKAPSNTTVVFHSNWHPDLVQRDKQIRRALDHKKPQFKGHGPNVLLLDGCIDYWPFHVSNVLRGNLAMAMRLLPEEGRLEPIGLTRTSEAYFPRHPEISAVVFKPRVRPGPQRVVFLNESGVALTDEEIRVLGKLADDQGFAL